MRFIHSLLAMLAWARPWVPRSVGALHLLALCAAGFAFLWQVHARRHHRQALQELAERTRLAEVRVRGEPSDSVSVQGCPRRLRPAAGGRPEAAAPAAGGAHWADTSGGQSHAVCSASASPLPVQCFFHGGTPLAQARLLCKVAGDTCRVLHTQFRAIYLCLYCTAPVLCALRSGASPAWLLVRGEGRGHGTQKELRAARLALAAAGGQSGPSAEALAGGGGEAYPMRPIGVAQSCFSRRNGTPRQPQLVPAARAVVTLRCEHPHGSTDLGTPCCWLPRRALWRRSRVLSLERPRHCLLLAFHETRTVIRASQRSAGAEARTACTATVLAAALHGRRERLHGSAE